ncbi:MAG: hypothetical protein MZV64_50405 [Ignavibacteriales bacterium]|nr:hypothetical protein [Ignavibacteriales bacterium]
MAPPHIRIVIAGQDFLGWPILRQSSAPTERCISIRFILRRSTGFDPYFEALCRNHRRGRRNNE